ncbi:MAG: DNA translocase FtsK [Acidobacteriota bacterium]
MSTATTAKTLPKLPLSAEKVDEIFGFLLAAFALLLTGSLLSHHPLDPSWLHHTSAADAATHNAVGPFGAQLSALAFSIFGLVSFLVPLLLGVEAWRRLTHRPRADVRGRALGVLGTLTVAPALVQLLVGVVSWQGEEIDAGGAVGVLLGGFLDSRFHTVGALVVLTTVLLVSGSLVAKTTLGALFGVAREQLAELWRRLTLARAQRRKRADERSTRRRVVRQVQGGEAGEVSTARPAAPSQSMPARGEAPRELEAPEDEPPRHVLERAQERSRRDAATARWVAPLTPRVRPPSARVEEGHVEPVSSSAGSNSGLIDLPLRVTERKGAGGFSVRKVSAAEREAKEVAAGRPAAIEAPPASAGPAPSSQPPARPAASARPVTAARPAPSGRAGALRPVSAEPVPGAVEESALTAQTDLGIEISPTELPPVNLLSTEKPVAHHEESELVRRGQMIQESAAHFGVDGEIAGISPGPVITVYEFRPGPGIKVSKVVNLQDDLALALKADSVRIDRLPGRSALGLEVPNHQRSIIHLGQLLDDERFQKAPSPLTMALGVDIHGKPVYYDLATMPHLLVAGATGAGKSVGLQSMITSILYKATKADVKFIFIDPKRVELGVYSEIPHLKTEVVVEPKKAANALRWAVAEMERRYRLLAEVHVRSIDIYNRAIGDPRERKKLSLGEGESEFSPDDFQRLPYYVIIIDELADLMMVASSDVEASIARLAQMARAVGIHLIIATQRPSVDVLTGTIKANFPCRLAFATATRHDSRTILDQVGAEKLLGKGDALFMPPGTSRIRRLHGAYISEQETAALVRWLKRRGEPDLDPSVVEAPEESGPAGGADGPAEDDPLYDEAARLVVKERQASASFLQRRMRVGFSRAARLVDMLEADGLLGPAQGSKPRDVLVPVDYFDEIESARRAVED